MNNIIKIQQLSRLFFLFSNEIYLEFTDEDQTLPTTKNVPLTQIEYKNSNH